jgi:hypothetical protein
MLFWCFLIYYRACYQFVKNNFHFMNVLVNYMKVGVNIFIFRNVCSTGRLYSLNPKVLLDCACPSLLTGAGSALCEDPAAGLRTLALEQTGERTAACSAFGSYRLNLQERLWLESNPPGQERNQGCLVGVLSDQGRALARLKIVGVEGWRHGRAQESEPTPGSHPAGPDSIGSKARPLPHAARHEALHALPVLQIVAQDHDLTVPTGEQKELLDRVTQIKMIDLVGLQAVKGGEFGGGQ